MLVGQIEGAPVSAEELFFEPEIVARGSTANAPRRRSLTGLTQQRRLAQACRKASETCEFQSSSCNRYVDCVNRRRRDADRDDRASDRRPPAPASHAPAGGATPSSTRSTCAASPTATATAPATSPASARGCRTCATSASTRSGSTPGTRRRWPTTATTSSTTARSTRRSAPSPRRRQLIARGARARHPHDRRRRPEPRLDEHRWFQAALARRPGLARARALLVPARPRRRTASCRRTAGSRSSAARRGRASTDGEWYLHLFAPEQPDLNWTHPDVWAEHEDVLRFWFDRGVAGVRIDSAALLVKDPELAEESADAGPGEHPFMDRDELHDIYRGWRAIADAYDEPRVLVGEIWLPDAERLARYLRRDELHTAFNFDFLACPWEPARLRASIDVGARRARAGRRADDLGALEPRRHPPGHALRPRRHVVRVRGEARGHADRPRARHAPRPRGGAARRWRCPARCTSTRARSSACPRSRTSPTTAARTRCGSARAASTPAATAAACRSRGRATGRRSGSAPTDAHDRGSTSRPTGRRSPSRREDARPGSMLALYRAGLRLRRDGPVGRAATLAWLATADDVARVRARRAASSVSSTSARTRSRSRPGADVLIASSELEGGARPAGHHGLAPPGRGQSCPTATSTGQGKEGR